jgi:hypothetical protein
MRFPKKVSSLSSELLKIKEQYIHAISKERLNSLGHVAVLEQKLQQLRTVIPLRPVVEGDSAKEELYLKRFELQEAVWKDIAQTCPDRTIVVLKKPERIDVDGMQFFIHSDFKRNSPRVGERLIVNHTDDVNKLNGFFSWYPLCFYDFRGGRLREQLPGFPAKDPLSVLR